MTIGVFSVEVPSIIASFTLYVLYVYSRIHFLLYILMPLANIHHLIYSVSSLSTSHPVRLDSQHSFLGQCFAFPIHSDCHPILALDYDCMASSLFARFFCIISAPTYFRFKRSVVHYLFLGLVGAKVTVTVFIHGEYEFISYSPRAGFHII